MKKKGESVDGRDGRVANKHSVLEETKGTKVVGDSGNTIMKDPSTRLVRKYTLNVDDVH
ncbi:hypothetical protein A2U01_0066668 [Trifolium medium]|uniref:Uncharacterized protein n=1 Tax=Trifolium medium TaxID=97028 RepID=A0A392S9S2_9FABA|nr:hypothetical protein [Trifolium medium]